MRNDFKRGTHSTTTTEHEAAKMVDRLAVMINNTQDPERRRELKASLRYWRKKAN